MFSPFRSLRSLSKPGMYLFFSFWQIAVTLGSRKCILLSHFPNLRSLPGSGNVSYFLLFVICGHFRIPECIFFSPFRSLRSLSKPGMYLFFSFWQIAVTFGSRSVSFFLIFPICGHFRDRKCILFSPFRNLQSLWCPKTAPKACQITKTAAKDDFLVQCCCF